MMIQVCYKRTGVVPVKFQKENLYRNQNFLISFLKLGFIPEQNFIENINKIDPEELKAILFEMAKMLGFDRNWEKTLFPDFPKYVTETPEEELKFHTFLHYLTTYGKSLLEHILGVEIKTYFPNEELHKEERQLTLEDIDKLGLRQTLVNKRFIDVKEEDECLRETFFSILYTNTPIAEDEVEFVKKVMGRFAGEIDINRVKFKEVKNLLFSDEKILEKIENIYPEDCFRYFVYALTENSQLLFSEKLKNELKRLKSANYIEESEIFWSLLSKCKKEDIVRFYNQKTKLCNLVFFMVNIKRMQDKREIARFCKTLKNGNMKKKRNTYKSDFGQLVQLFCSKIQTDKLLSFFKDKPHMFVAEFNMIYKNLYSQNATGLVSTIYDEIKERLSNKLLIRLYNNLSINFNRDRKFDNTIYVLPNRRTFIKQNEAYSLGYDYLNDAKILQTYIFAEILQRLQGKLKGKRIVLDTRNLDLGCKIPLTTRGKDFEYENGSVLKINEKTEYLRTGIYWKGANVDLDLSAIFLSDRYQKIEIVNWSNRRKTNYAIFSGDVTSAPNGAAEFIDIHIQKALRSNIRYVVVANYIYRNDVLKDFFCGVQCRNDAIEGEVKHTAKELFNPQNVRYSMSKDIPASANSIVLFVLDLQKKEIYPLNVPNNNSSIVAGEDMETTKSYIENIIYRWRYKLSYEQLLSSFALDAKGKIAGDETDVIEGICPHSRGFSHELGQQK